MSDKKNSNTFDPSKHIVILGAGITGLALAYYIKQQGYTNLTLLEKSSRVGGWLHTSCSNGYLFERGPHTLRPHDEESLSLLELIEELDLEEKVIVSNESAAIRYLYNDNKLEKIPTTFWQLFTHRTGRDLLKALAWDLLGYCYDRHAEDTSIWEFMHAKCGKRFTESFIDAMTTGIYAGDCKELSMRSCFPKLWQLAQQKPSIVRAFLANRKNRKTADSSFVQKMKKSALYSFKGGIEILPKALHLRLASHIATDSEVIELKQKKDGIVIQLAEGKTLFADYVLSTLPSHSLLPLIKNSATQSLYEMLQKVQHADIAAVHLGWSTEVLPFSAFGYLIPDKEKQPILGAIFDSMVFPQQNTAANQTRLTVMLGGIRHRAFMNKASVEELSTIARETVCKHLNIKEKPAYAAISIAEKAIPQYPIKHHLNLLTIQQELAKSFPLLSLHGSNFFGVSVNSCIDQAKKSIQKIFSPKK